MAPFDAQGADGPSSNPALALTVMHYRFPHEARLVSARKVGQCFEDLKVWPAFLVAADKFVIPIGLQ